jgi:hypothetical protein
MDALAAAMPTAERAVLMGQSQLRDPHRPEEFAAAVVRHIQRRR